MDFKKYGFSKSNPDYWLKTSQAIWTDNGLTQDDKMKAQGELVQIYQNEKRDKTARTTMKTTNSGHVGKMTPEMIKAEIKSIKNTKALFRTAKQKKRLKELEGML